MRPSRPPLAGLNACEHCIDPCFCLQRTMCDLTSCSWPRYKILHTECTYLQPRMSSPHTVYAMHTTPFMHQAPQAGITACMDDGYCCRLGVMLLRCACTGTCACASNPAHALPRFGDIRDCTCYKSCALMVAARLRDFCHACARVPS
jgi:hypothetical protein